MLSGFGLRAIGLALITCFGIALATSATAQTISQPANNGFVPGDFVGQSFTATVSGTVTQIRVIPIADNVTTLRLYNGTGTGAPNAAGTPLYSQAVNLTDTDPAFQTITLGTPLPITAGNVYSFAFDTANLRAATPGTSYAGGIVFSEGITLFNNVDLTFEVVQVAAAPVPTLSEWALILLGLMLAGGAAIYIQRRQMAA